MRFAKLTKNPLFYLCLVLFFVLAFQIFNFVALAFREPNAAFPNDTPAAPLDTSTISQTKDGELMLKRLTFTDSGFSYTSGSGICLKDNANSAGLSCKLYWDSIGAGWALNGNDIYNTNSGSVGIGTTTPLQKLRVSGGNIWLDGNKELGWDWINTDRASIRFESTGDASGASKLIIETSDNADEPIEFRQSGNVRMVISNIGPGNVGIGTTAPSVKLHVYESALDKSGALVNIATTSASYYSLNVQSAGTSRLYVRADGNVGIGTTNPKAELEVIGAVSSTQVCISGDCRNAWPAGGSSQWQDISGGGIYYSGSVGIGASTFNTTTYKLYVAGTAVATDGWESVSDARLKTNVQELNGALQKILRLRGVSFNWLNGNQASQIGLIAQEVEKEFPELVTTASDGYKSLAYDRLTAVLLEAIKEQQKQIETLSARLKALEENTSR